MALSRCHKASLSRYTASPYPYKYHVFLSFRGADTRKRFTDHLYHALVNAGFHTFRDDPQLPRGENIRGELENAIQQSRCSVIVFSEHYTESKWCLDELLMILKCRRTSDHYVLPVFYDINPFQLKKRAKFLDDVPKYIEPQSREKLEAWEAAITEVTHLAGKVLENEADGHEAKFIQEIITLVQDKLGSVSLSPHDQEKLLNKLRFANHVVEVSEGKQLTNPIVSDQLIELKEAVFDAEDLLQESDAKALWQKMEPVSGSSTSKVLELNSSSHAYSDLRVDEVISRLNSSMGHINSALGMQASTGDSLLPPPPTSLIPDSVHGRDKDKEILIDLLLTDDENNNNIGVIPIVGMGGIGKTTLAQVVYNDATVEKHFDFQAWACVSEKFDVAGISQQIHEFLPSHDSIVSLAPLQSYLKKALNGKKIFLVLDNVWNINYAEWDVLKRPFQSVAPGSKIIFTTRNRDVASMVCTRKAHCLMPMFEEDGWSLFKEHAFKDAEIGTYSHLEEIGRQIVRKCNGLPLAIKSLGSLLCSKLVPQHWKNILHSEMWESIQGESLILPSLWLSYKHLHPDLKSCFIYCSIFPKNYRFKKAELVLLWKAQGLLQTDNKRIEVEEVGEKYFNDLISRSFFQSSPSSEYVIMHDLIHDLANFAAGVFSVRWDGSESPNAWRQTRHFSYREKNGDSFTELEVLCKAPHLRTLLPIPEYSFYLGTFKRDKFQKVLHVVLPKLKCLRVLKLSMYNIEELPDSIQNLSQLRHLDMSETTIRKLPDTICTLYNLQALLLAKCRWLKALPTNLGRLFNLSHLDIRDTRIEKMPPSIGDLNNLQTLTEFVVGKNTAENDAAELKKLGNLRGSCSISRLGNVGNGKALVADIMRGKKFLTELNLDCFCEEGNNRVQEREVLEKLQPHLDLKRLTIKHYGGKMFPSWSDYFSSSSLVYLKLVRCENCIYLPPLGQLPSLRELIIDTLPGVVFIGSEFYYGDDIIGTRVEKPFRSLRSLSFYNMSGWEKWCRGEDNECGNVFPRLVNLVLSSCTNLTWIPEMRFLSKLVSLEIYDCGKLFSNNMRDLKMGLRRSTSLEELSLDFGWFPFDKGLFPSTLTSLEIYRLNCWSINSAKDFDHLNSLQKLVLRNCGSKSMLPSFLCDLEIYRRGEIEAGRVVPKKEW